jgi:predicted rRNA methylase YqxC with S4 and FtsJ domains
MKQYKVLTQKDRFFAGKFDPEKLESAINSYASEGWEVVSIATAKIPSLTGNREELIVVMEREK